MFIYKITNRINNKMYIGQTINGLEARFKRHINDAINNILDTHFARAIREHGKENFYIELIDVAESIEELKLKEQYWINFYDSTHKGYNETDALHKCGGNTYKSKTKEEMLCIGQKIAHSKQGGKNPKARKVKCKNIKTQEELFFDSLIECKNYFNEQTHRFITTRVQHKTRSLYKGEWAIAYVEEEYLFEEVVNKKGKMINTINLKTLETKSFASIRLLSRTLNIDRSTITKHISNNESDFIIGDYKLIILN